MRLRILLLFVLFSFAAYSQNLFHIKGTITGYSRKKLYLYGFYGNKKFPFDSTITSASGKFDFTLFYNNYTGLYRLIMSKDKKIDLVFDNENIEFSTNLTEMVDSMNIIASDENKLFYEYLRNKSRNEDKLTLLNQLMSYYPKPDPFYKKITSQFLKVQQDELNYSGKLVKSNPGKYFINIVNFQQLPILDPELDEEKQTEYLKKHYFDYIQIYDTTILNSDLIPVKIISFLSLYLNRELNHLQQEKALNEATDIIVKSFRENDKIYSFVYDFLIKGYNEMGMDKTLGYLIDNYEPGATCSGKNDDDDLAIRIKNYNKLTTGKKAPDFESENIDGKKVRLSEIPEEYTLLIFWFSDCPHCRHILPIINHLYSSQKIKTFEVFAISLDTSLTTWTNFIKNGKYGWINVCDSRSWEGKAATAYSIYETPSMFLIDKKGIIAGKPNNEKELKALLKDKKLIQ